MAKVLLVDDDEIVLTAIAGALQQSSLEVTTASNVPEALKLITSERFDVLISDLHMPGAGDGLTAISAMRHANPEAITLLLSAFPEMTAATQAILLQADEILVKPMDLSALVDVIKQRLALGPVPKRLVQSVAQIVQRNTESILQAWYRLVQKEEKLQSIAMSYEQRTHFLHQVLRELVCRLKSSKEIGGKGLVSVAAGRYGVERRRLGYSAAMLVEESRMLQVSVFQTLEENLASIDFSVLLIGVMTVADEIDSQLSQAMAAYEEESVMDERTA
jgi:YesN/AraC family two-component response regulator